MKKTMRKLSVFGVAFLLLFALAACGGGSTPAEDPADGEENQGEEVEDPNPTAGGDFVIYSDNAFAPFEYLDTTTGKYVGVDMDILAAIAEDQGFSYEVRNEGFDAAMGAVQAGTGDAMIAGMTITDERAETFDFSDGYFEDGQIMVVAAASEITDLEGIRGKTVAAKIGTMSTEYVRSIEAEYELTVVDFEDSPTMYAAVIQGNCDVCFEDRSVVEWAIKDGGMELKTVGEVIEPRFYGFATKKGENAELISMFNAGLANIKTSGEYDTILAEYGY